MGPAAVRTVAFRMTVARDAKGAYVLGKGSAFGVDSAPRFEAADGVELAGVTPPAGGVVRAPADVQPASAAERASAVTAFRMSLWVGMGGDPGIAATGAAPPAARIKLSALRDARGSRRE
jgi:hypothetical protein